MFNSAYLETFACFGKGQYIPSNIATAGNSQKFRRKTKTAAERFKAFKKCTWN
jgi:hypothetical protein